MGSWAGVSKCNVQRKNAPYTIMEWVLNLMICNIFIQNNKLFNLFMHKCFLVDGLKYRKGTCMYFQYLLGGGAQILVLNDQAVIYALAGPDLEGDVRNSLP